jgi:hypothetical protein
VAGRHHEVRSLRRESAGARQPRVRGVHQARRGRGVPALREVPGGQVGPPSASLTDRHSLTPLPPPPPPPSVHSWRSVIGTFMALAKINLLPMSRWDVRMVQWVSALAGGAARAACAALAAAPASGPALAAAAPGLALLTETEAAREKARCAIVGAVAVLKVARRHSLSNGSQSSSLTALPH